MTNPQGMEKVANFIREYEDEFITMLAIDEVENPAQVAKEIQLNLAVLVEGGDLSGGF